MTDKLIQRPVISVGEATMDMRVILEQEKVELNFGFHVCGLVDYFIDRFNLTLNKFFCVFIPSFNEIKYFIQPFN